MISVETALETVLSHAPSLAAEEIDLPDALGRVLAEDVVSDHDMPSFDRSAMDGYALRAEDTVEVPVRLRTVGQVRAGQWPGMRIEPGEAVEIMTGAPVPAGATAVQQVEKTRRLEGGLVEVLAPVEPAQNVAGRGSEVRAGDRVLSRGEAIDPATVAVLAAVGKARVRVGLRPTLSVLVTGDELVELGEAPTGARIRNSNGHALLAQARAAGAEARSLGVVPDVADRIAVKVREGLESDVLVLSGGVSAGAFDFVEAVLGRFEVEILFSKVAIKPGAPLVFGRLPKRNHLGGRTTLVFGLPGNPVSAQVTFEVFVRAALRRMQGARVVSRPMMEVELLDPVKNRSGRRAHLPARVGFDGGRLVARMVRSQGSADLVAHAQANALVVMDAGRTTAGAGERAPALLLGNFLDRDGA
jgi:molybdopterin molybdotransferase